MSIKPVFLLSAIFLFVVFSCRKNLLEDVELEANSLEEGTDCYPLIIDSTFSNKNFCRLYVYLSPNEGCIKDTNKICCVKVYRDGKEKAVMPEGNYNFVDLSISCWTTYIYEFVLLDTSGFETKKTQSLEVYIN
ncbi:MAG: hypothetical protein COA57_05880 [Flavobacteriales bacterium]|nr:MAG: hypothetical protein COA57_05880 [Flavobacteriales bacterium]